MSAVFEQHGPFIKEVLERFERQVLRGIPPSLLSTAEHQLRGMKRTKGWRIGLVQAACSMKQAPYSLDLLLNLGQTACALHEISLIVDDLLDGDLERRGQLSLHEHSGRNRAGFLAGWYAAKAFEGHSQMASTIKAIAEVIERVVWGEAEQEALSKGRGERPTSVLIWEKLALDDTGAFFFFPFKALGVGGDWKSWVERLALLYHGLDDLEDILGEGSLAGGGDADVRDGVPTLLTCFSSGRSREELRGVAKEAWYGLMYYFSSVPTPPAALAPFFKDLWEALSEVKKLIFKEEEK